MTYAVTDDNSNKVNKCTISLKGLCFTPRQLSLEEMTHTCNFIQQGLLDQEDCSSYHVSQLLLGR